MKFINSIGIFPFRDRSVHKVPSIGTSIHLVLLDYLWYLRSIDLRNLFLCYTQQPKIYRAIHAGEKRFHLPSIEVLRGDPGEDLDTIIGGDYVVHGETIKIATYLYRHGQEQRIQVLSGSLEDLYAMGYEICAAILAYLHVTEKTPRKACRQSTKSLVEFSSYLDRCLLGESFSFAANTKVNEIVKRSESPLLHYLYGLTSFVGGCSYSVQAKHLARARHFSSSFLPAFFPYKIPVNRSPESDHAWRIARTGILKCAQYRDGWYAFAALSILEERFDELLQALCSYVRCWNSYAFDFLGDFLSYVEDLDICPSGKFNAFRRKLIEMTTAAYRRTIKRSHSKYLRRCLRVLYAAVLDSQALLFKEEGRLARAEKCINTAIKYVPTWDIQFRNVLYETRDAIYLAKEKKKAREK